MLAYITGIVLNSSGVRASQSANFLNLKIFFRSSDRERLSIGDGETKVNGVEMSQCHQREVKLEGTSLKPQQVVKKEQTEEDFRVRYYIKETISHGESTKTSGSHKPTYQGLLYKKSCV